MSHCHCFHCIYILGFRHIWPWGPRRECHHCIPGRQFSIPLTGRIPPTSFSSSSSLPPVSLSLDLCLPLYLSAFLDLCLSTPTHISFPSPFPFHISSVCMTYLSLPHCGLDLPTKVHLTPFHNRYLCLLWLHPTDHPPSLPSPPSNFAPGPYSDRDFLLNHRPSLPEDQIGRPQTFPTLSDTQTSFSELPLVLTKRLSSLDFSFPQA